MDGAVFLVIIVAVVLLGLFVFWRGRKNLTRSGAGSEGLQTIAGADTSARSVLRASVPVTSAPLPTEDDPANKMAYLEIVDGPNAVVKGRDVGKRVSIGKTRLTIGRNARQADFQLYSLDEPSSVSRLHCTIEFNPGLGCFMIIDEGSSSGTKIGGRQIAAYQPHSLIDGDMIELGMPDKMGAILSFHTTFNPPESGGRISLDAGVQHKNTLRQYVGAIGATAPLKCDVFLSYSRKDRDLMRVVRKTLETHKILVWSDENLEPGSPSWHNDIQNAIENARSVVAILSPDAKDSEWVNEELNYAKIRKVRIFTVLVRGDESNAIPFGMTGVQWIDMRTDYTEGIQEIVYETATEQLLARLNEYLGRG